MKRTFIIVLAIIFCVAWAPLGICLDKPYVDANGYGHFPANVVEDGLSGGEYYLAYGEHKDFDESTDEGNSWGMEGSNDRDLAKKDGDQIIVKMPSNWEKYRGYDSRTEEFFSGFRCNFYTIGPDGKPGAWSQIHRHRAKLGKNYINLGPGPGGEIQNRNGFWLTPADRK